MRSSLLFAVIAATFASPAGAQVLRGRFVDPSGRPIVGALVGITDSAGARFGTLTDSSGEYVLQARYTGLHALGIERIGLATQRGAVMLQAGATGLTETLRGVPITLPDAKPGAIAACGNDPAFRPMWDEARKMLRMIALAEQIGLVRVNGVRYLRELDGNTKAQLAIIDQESFTLAGVPAREPPADAPPGQWFAITDSTRPMYFAASARALASDDFERSHCFTRITSDDRDTTRTGLSFEPRNGITSVGIAGTLWIDRVTARPLSIEYSYATGPGTSTMVASGLVEFSVRPNAIPHVVRWWLRLPVTRVVSRQGRAQEARTIVEDGVLVVDNTLSPISDPDHVLPALRGAFALDPLIVEAKAEDRRRVIIPTVSARPFDVLSESEIRLTGPTNAYDLIKTTRSRWLRMRGVSLIGEATPVQVYLDGVRFRYQEPIPDATAATREVLERIPVADIEAMQYLDPIEAPIYFGLGHDNGAILITSRNR